MQSLKRDLAVFMYQARCIREGESQEQSFTLVLMSSKTGADLTAAEGALRSFSKILVNGWD